MSTVTDIVESVKTEVETLLPTYKELPFSYVPELNSRLADKNYALRLGAANTATTTNNAITFDHTVYLDLSSRFELKKNTGDKELAERILGLHTDIETLYKYFYKRTGLTSKVMLISPIDLSEPNIDNDNNLVTVTLTLTVKYRVAT